MMTPTQSKRWRLLRRCLLAAAVVLTVIAAFYTEESWRGKRAWENCKRALEAKGIKVHQEADIPPPPVPDDQNVLAMPEMRQWFLGDGPSDLSERLGDIADITEGGDTNHPATRVVVAEVAFSQPGSNSPAGFTVLTYGDPKAKAEVTRLIEDAVGPDFSDAWGNRHLVRRPEEIHPVKILLQCQTAPSAKELEQFLTNGFHPEGTVDLYEEGNAKFEPAANGSCQVTMQVPSSAAELLATIAVLEPQFTVMRQAFQRPYVRILGADVKHFAGFGYLARVLDTQAKCHLILGQPEEALRDLTLIKDLCRLVEDPPGSKSGMVAMLVRATLTAIDMDAIADGLSRHAWSGPQLAVLQDQLKNLNFVSDLKQALLAGPARVSDYYPKITAHDVGQYLMGNYFSDFIYGDANAWTRFRETVVGELIPRGWIYQNMVQLANDYADLGESLDSSGPLVYPKKVDAIAILATSHPSPYNVARRSHDYGKTCRNMARVQTQVHQALIACALERYRLAHNEYPETLAALVPQFLAQVPRDIIGGQPLHYRRADDGKFLLYSVGWNETDDGGKPGSDDDWVWDAPPR
jgi:hypothetical protein